MLDSRNHSRGVEPNLRERIVQQPGPFYNGNPSSSIWGRGSGSVENFWTNGSDPCFMDISPAPAPRKAENQMQPEIFVFGSGGAPSTSAGFAPPPFTTGVSVQHGNGQTPSDQNVEHVGGMLNNMHIRSDAASTSGLDGKVFARAFSLGSATQPGAQVNARPRFTKLRKSTHQTKARLPDTEVKVADVVDVFGSAFVEKPSTLGTDGEQKPSTSGTDGEQKPSTSGTDGEQNVSKAKGTSEGEGERSDEKARTMEQPAQEQVQKSDVFSFTAMRNSVPAIPKAQDLTEEANSVAASLAALKLPQVSQPTTTRSAQNEEAQADVSAPETSRTQDVQTDDQAAERSGTKASSSEAARQPFVFGSNLPQSQGDIRNIFATSYVTSSGAKKKDKVRKTSNRSKPSRPADTFIFEDQGSPMDISPCPQRSRSGPYEEERSNVPAADIEALRMATANLELRAGSEEPVGNSAPFSFTASSSSCARTPQRPSRRVGSKGKLRPRTSIFEEPKQAAPFPFVPVPPTSFRPDAEQTCESWRLRGNEAYASGDFPKAEEYYSLGTGSVPDNETSQRCIRALMLCYSNRAATRMAVGRMADALSDCVHAMSLDPNFLRARVRAGSCHLALGEAEQAAMYFKDCLNQVGLHEQNDQKIAADATDGLDKAQQVQEYIKSIWGHASEDNVTAALRLTNEALVLSPYSETLLEMKARWLLSLHKLDEAIEMCGRTLVQAETNWARRCPKYWRSWVKSKALFYVGKLEDSLECMQKLGDAVSLSGTDTISDVLGANMQTLSQFNALIQVLMQHKAAGNEAFQAGKHTEAIEHYTAALSCNSEARPFNAVLYCNRAAAFQALNHIADAIADASRAVSLETKYAKAISRRATLHALIRDYAQACADLRKLTTLLDSHTKENSRKTSHDLKEARDRLASAEEELRKDHPVDHYMILGLNPACTAVEVKKAYRKLALRHHPDKAGQVANVSTDDDADRLFKLIGEAYAVLSDPAKRARYDADEELRRGRMRGANNAASSYYYPNASRNERNGRRQRDGWDTWSAYYAQRWQYEDHGAAAQPDYYARDNKDQQQARNFKDFYPRECRNHEQREYRDRQRRDRESGKRSPDSKK